MQHFTLELFMQEYTQVLIKTFFTLRKLEIVIATVLSSLWWLPQTMEC